MEGRRFRWLGAGLLASGGAGLLTLTSMMNAAFAFGVDDPALIMGGTGNPEPDLGYVDSVYGLYINPQSPAFPTQPVYPWLTPQGVYTPEQFWPVTPNLGNLTFDQSVGQGVTDLNNAITAVPTGQDIVVFGYSQSATIATDEMRSLMANPATAPDPSHLSFVLIGDPNNPDGGILERFAGLCIPGLGVSFNGATPPDTPFPTDIYSLQYDGIADAPQFPIDPASDANAIAGYFYLHGTYPTLTVAQLATVVALPTSPGYSGVTDYFMLPAQDLPLLDPLRQLPVVGNPVADLLQPDVRVFVDLGYGDGYANVPTTAGLLPLFNPVVVGIDLAKGAEQGVVASLVDVDALPAADLPDSYPYLPDPTSGLSTSLLNLLTGDSQMGILGLLTGGLITANSLPDLPDLLSGSDTLALPALDLATLLPGLEFPGSLLAVPDALGAALDPMLFLAPLAFLGL
jgi:hypothetical protein